MANAQETNPDIEDAPENAQDEYSFVSRTARIALYDDLRSAPRITEIQPDETNQYIMNIATQTYEQAKLAGGHIPFTIIKEVSENFIHARFSEVIVSILDDGNTIRFADQGPGISDKDKAQKPGFSSANEHMKRYIRGVGSGLPIVKDYFDESHGTVTIEDNIKSGAVVTISLNKDRVPSDDASRGSEQSAVADQAEDHERSEERLSSRRQRELYDQGRRDYARAPQGYAEYERPYEEGRYETPYERYREENGRGRRSSRPRVDTLAPPLNERERLFLELLLDEGTLGVTELSKLSDVPASSTHSVLSKLEQAGLVERTDNQKKRTLTEFGYNVACSLR